MDDDGRGISLCLWHLSEGEKKSHPILPESNTGPVAKIAGKSEAGGSDRISEALPTYNTGEMSCTTPRTRIVQEKGCHALKLGLRLLLAHELR